MFLNVSYKCSLDNFISFRRFLKVCNSIMKENTKILCAKLKLCEKEIKIVKVVESDDYAKR